MTAPTLPSDAWSIWLDRGGTFTDCVAVRGDELRTAKVLSREDAPGDAIVAAIRAVLRLPPGARMPPCDVRVGTTLATNALLERRGAPTALAITAGLGDLCAIGDQARPALFALDIVKPTVPYAEVLEIDARAAPDGAVLRAPDDAALEAALAAARARGLASLAVAVLHGHRAPALEQQVAAAARRAGFAHVSCASELAGEPGLLARADTAVVDAYLSPVLADAVARLRRALPGCRLRMMQSSGGLTDAARFRGRDAVLGGPAGGVVACAAVARAAGHPRALGFDMGGTSTDVCCVDGELDRVDEAQLAGVRVRAPMLAIHTIAAGGGSLCRWDGLRLTVGPDSAGATPGPLCYGHPAATEPTLTDVDLVLGRLAGDQFPLPLDAARAEAALAALGARLPAPGPDPARTAAAGLFAIANAAMADAIRRVSIARGRDAREFALVVFGGAGGMHACPVAEELGITTLLLPRHAGVLSALGVGLAPVTWHGERDAGGRRLDDAALAALAPTFDALCAEGRAALAADGIAAPTLTRLVALRYVGAEDTLALPLDDAAALAAAFADRHRARFGYARPDDAVEVVTARVEATGRDTPEVLPGAEPATASGAGAAEASPAGAAGAGGAPARTVAMWTGRGREPAPVLDAAALPVGATVRGPALLLYPTSTVALDRGWTLRVCPEAGHVTRDGATATAAAPDLRGAAAATPDAAPDPVSLEVYGNLFMSIAEQMGAALQRTAVSTNIRERLDFSCAIFDAAGQLVANAPHIPVHLGAMGETVRALLAAHPEVPPGTVYASNDPFAGGSHLPDVTVVTPVHDADGGLLYVTASRGHHADVGGLTPGSMPPFAARLADEGVVLRHLPIVEDGVFRRDRVLAALAAGPHPARRPLDNLADLEAQLAAGRTGARLLAEARARRGDEVLAYLGHVQRQAAALVRRAIAALPDGDHRFADALDDGTAIVVTVRVRGDRLTLDFTGTGPAHPGNLNAPRAVTVAAALYVMRALVGAPIPLNAGCLEPVELVIPPGSVLDPPPGRAVCGGNVETSQRVVDVLLGALGLAAASQGTMNNLTFGRAAGEAGPALAYYETVCGGAGATPRAPGASAVHTHMTNTRITDPELLEARFPVRVRRFAIRRGSGGAGRHRGGDGVIRELELLAPLQVCVVAQRRSRAPFGLAGGAPGAVGRTLLDGRELGASAAVDAPAGAVLTLETPGGGGWGPPGDDA